MRMMAAAKFKAHCLSVMDEVAKKREPVTITKNGKPVARLGPIEEDTDLIFGFMRGRGSITGDVMSPVISVEDWNAPR